VSLTALSPFKTRHGKVLEVGITDRRLTRSRRAAKRVLRSWEPRAPAAAL